MFLARLSSVTARMRRLRKMVKSRKNETAVASHAMNTLEMAMGE